MDKICKRIQQEKNRTSFSEIKNLFLRKIHAVTFKGFLLKLLMFIVAFTFKKLTNISLATLG